MRPFYELRGGGHTTGDIRSLPIKTSSKEFLRY